MGSILSLLPRTEGGDCYLPLESHSNRERAEVSLCADAETAETPWNLTVVTRSSNNITNRGYSLKLYVK